MRRIDNLVYHCTASSTDATVEGILKYWREVEKWKNPGYNVIIKRDGTPVVLAHISKVTNGVGGHNANSVHISYIGGVEGKNNTPVDNRTPEQIQTQIFFGKAIKSLYHDINILGHRDFPNVKKACPCFDVKSDLVPYIEEDVYEGIFDYEDTIQHPFFKLIKDIKHQRNRPEHTPYEKKLYDAFNELTK